LQSAACSSVYGQRRRLATRGASTLQPGSSPPRLTLINQLAGEFPNQQIADKRPDSTALTRSIELRLERVNSVLGLIDLGETLGELQPSDIERILSALGCQVTPEPAQEGGVDGDSAAVSLSGLRAEIDLIEEIARVYGYNNFCETLPDKTEAGYLSVEQQLIRRLREASAKWD